MTMGAMDIIATVQNDSKTITRKNKLYLNLRIN